MSINSINHDQISIFQTNEDTQIYLMILLTCWPSCALAWAPLPGIPPAASTWRLWRTWPLSPCRRCNPGRPPTSPCRPGGRLPKSAGACPWSSCNESAIASSTMASSSSAGRSSMLLISAPLRARPPPPPPRAPRASRPSPPPPETQGNWHNFMVSYEKENTHWFVNK